MGLVGGKVNEIWVCVRGFGGSGVWRKFGI